MKKFLSKLKSFILRNKLLSILLFLLILILIFGLVMIKVIIFPNYKVTNYGNRLDGIDSVKLDDSRFNDIKSSFSSSSLTLESIRLSGKIVNISFKVNDDVSVDHAKSSCSKVLESFSEDELKYYDIQIFVTSSNQDDDKYPIIGYKNKNSEGLHWNYEGEI